MEKNCINCKYFYNGICNNKNLNIDIEVNNNDGISYIEDGILSENLRENLNFKNIIKIITNQLQMNDIIKKAYHKENDGLKKTIDKIDMDDIENLLIEEVDNSISRSIINYFNSDNQYQAKKINNPYEFSCYYWE